MSDETTQRLTRIENELAVRNAISRYCFAIDDGDLIAVARHLHRDVTFVSPLGASMHGRDVVVRFFEDLWSQDRPAAKHHITSMDVDASEPLEIVVRSQFLHLVEGQPPNTGNYRDMFRVEDGSVSCMEKRITLDNTP